MKYIIDIARRKGANSFETQTVLITDDVGGYLSMWNAIEGAFAKAGTLLGSYADKDTERDVTRLRIEYDMFGKPKKARKGSK